VVLGTIGANGQHVREVVQVVVSHQQENA